MIQKEWYTENSYLYHITPSETARRILYTCTSCGHYFCDDTYFVDREPLSELLLIQVVQGDFYAVNHENVIMDVHAGDTVLVDCFVPQIYGTRHSAEIKWAHISGANLSALTDELILRCGGIIRGGQPEISELIGTVLEMCRTGNTIGETQLSLMILRALYEALDSASGKPRSGPYSVAVSNSIRYIRNNYAKSNLTVTEIAKSVHLSATHFRRVFSKEMGVSPHEFLMKCRIAEAKQLLLSGSCTVKEAAYLTGFGNESNFIYAFRKNMGIPPGKWAAQGGTVR